MNKLFIGDSLEVLKTLPSETVQCCVTSPPYWGLRDYQVDGQLGLEKTPEEYIEKLVMIFEEVRRVLKKDGVLWLNLGDSFASGSQDNFQYGKNSIFKQERTQRRAPIPLNLKPKDLCMIPARVAIALQSSGWWLRSEIVWSKPNPIPESVTDRPTKSHEMIYLLTKSARYFYDMEAVREVSKNIGKTSIRFGGNKYGDNDNKMFATKSGNEYVDNGKRNKRTVWEIPTQPYRDAHFATFPTEIPRICIAAGTSEKGECPECGKNWKREVKPTEEYAKLLGTWTPDTDKDKQLRNEIGFAANGKLAATTAQYITVGWFPQCSCNKEPISNIVLDPFNGSGTTGEVALRMGRYYWGIDLNEKYVKDLSLPRLSGIEPLLTQIEIHSTS